MTGVTNAGWQAPRHPSLSWFCCSNWRRLIPLWWIRALAQEGNQISAVIGLAVWAHRSNVGSSWPEMGITLHRLPMPSSNDRLCPGPAAWSPHRDRQPARRICHLTANLLMPCKNYRLRRRVLCCAVRQGLEIGSQTFEKCRINSVPASQTLARY